MLCPPAPCSSRANETPVSSPVSNGQPICFCWVSVYCDYSCTCTWHSHLFLCLFLGGFILISFFVRSICGFCTYLPTSGLIYAICVFLLLLELGSRSLCKFCLLSFGSWHPFSLCFGWYSISKSAWYVISCVILGTLSISSVCCVFLLLFNHCSGLVPSSIFLFDGWIVFVCIEHF